MVEEFDLTVVDATLDVHQQQQAVRRIIEERIDLAFYHKRYVQ